MAINITVEETIETVDITTTVNETIVNVTRQSGGGGGVWGGITGTLSDQTDLQSALNAKEPTITAGTTSQYFRGDKTFQTLDKTAVGLGNVNNTSDADKPISDSTQSALNAKANVSGQVFTGAISATNLSGTNTGDETTLSIQTKRPLKTINNVSLEGSGNASLKPDVRHFFPFNHTFTASTSWFTFARESASLYDLAFWTSTAYNGTTVLDNRIVKFPLPYNCKLKNVQIIYTSVATTVDIRLLYFECISNNSSVINQTTLGSISIASNPSQVQQIVDFTTQDNITSLASGGFVTIAMFNNNISAALMRNVTIIVDFEPI